MSDYPNKPGVRAGSPETSAAAADSVADAAANRERMAFALIRSKGLQGATADEVADAFEWERYSSRPRLSTLRAAGKIVDGGMRRKGASGRNQAVWIAKEFADKDLPEQGDLFGQAA